tara:strand:- start:525 stop:1271 length:747 start_codon:yes stop_codon:yes gene_type:complete
MYKKGQLTIFIIVGLMLLTFLGIFLIYSNNDSEVEIETIDKHNIQLYVDKCIQTSLDETLMNAGLKGGYILPPENSLRTLHLSVPYYYDEGRISIPSEEDIYNEIKTYFKLTLLECVNNFEVFEYNFSFNEIKEIELDTFRGYVRAKVEFPVSVYSLDQSVKLNDFEGKSSLKFIDLYEASSKIIERVKETPYAIDLSFTSSLENHVDIYEQSPGIIVYAVHATNSDFMWVFATKSEVREKEDIIENV